MKHIKTYEVLRSELKLDKYIIWKSSLALNIFKVLRSSNQSTLLLERLYMYSEKGLEKAPFEKYDEIITLQIDDVMENVIYSYIEFQSNSLQECIDIIPTIIDSNKFNL